MKNKENQSEEFTLPTTPIRYTVRNGSLVIGKGDRYGLISFNKETGVLNIQPVDDVMSEGK
jgi:hypothetical protein